VNACRHNFRPLRVHAALVEAGKGELLIYMEGDLSDKSFRCKLEKMEIETMMKAGVPLLNNDGPADASRLKSRISFLEKELATARASLASIGK